MIYGNYLDSIHAKNWKIYQVHIKYPDQVQLAIIYSNIQYIYLLPFLTIYGRLPQPQLWTFRLAHPCPAQPKLDPPHQQARCKDSRQKLSENCVLVGMWARICNCNHASFIPGPFVTQQHVEVSLAQITFSFKNASLLRSWLFKGSNKMHLEWLMMVTSQQYQIHPSPTELLPPKPQPGKHSKPCGQNNWQNEGQGKFQVGGLAQGCCKWCGVQGLFRRPSVYKFSSTPRPCASRGQTMIWSNTQILQEMPVNHTKLTSPPGQSAVGTAPGTLPLLPAALAQQCECNGVYNNMYLGLKEPVATRHTLNPNEKWSFTWPSSYESFKTTLKQKNTCLVYNGKAFDRSESQSSRPAGKLVINKLLARTIS